MAITAGKYHIGENGVPGICKAVKDRCPYTKTGHFDTQADAVAESNILMAKKFGFFVDDYSEEEAPSRILDSINYVQALSTENGKTLFQDMSSIIGHGEKAIAKRGLTQESFAAYAYAEDLNLDDSFVMSTKSGLSQIYSNDDDSIAKERLENVHAKALATITKKLVEHGHSIKDQDSLIKALHYSKDGENIVAQMGGSNTLDVAIIKGNDIEIVEVKEIQGAGAQIPSKVFSVDKDGRPVGDFSGIDPEIAEVVKRTPASWAVGTNLPINVTKRQSLEYFVDHYKSAGASKLALLNSRNEIVEFNITGDTPSVVKSLENNHVEAQLQIRTNQNYGRANKVDRARWKEKRGEFFKDNKFPDESFKLSDIKKKYRSYESCGGKATLGEMVLPYSKKQLATLPPDTEIKLKDLQVRKYMLTGSIKEVPDSRKKQVNEDSKDVA